MSKAGQRLIGALQEAVAIAKGEQPAAAIYHNGHKYVPAAELEMLTAAGIIEVAIRNPSYSRAVVTTPGKTTSGWCDDGTTARTTLSRIRGTE